MEATFTTAVLRFAALLHDEYGFEIARAKTQDALRAAETVGVVDRKRLRNAFRAVFCSSPDDVARFDAAFEAFFGGPEGVVQPELPPQRVPQPGLEDTREHPQRSRDDDRSSDAATAWQAMLARYSPAEGRSESPEIAAEGLDAMLDAASRLVRRVPLGRSRRWKPARNGTRFDMRRTLRESLQTGGDPIALHRLGPPLRNPRFIVLIDGSRSMAVHAGPVLQFAYALCLRSRRTNAFVFSTDVRDVTRELRAPDLAGTSLSNLDAAWGGGTKIGASLDTIVRTRGARLLSPDTVVFIASDGLDVGDLGTLERAMRTLRARTAGVVWLHPHAASPGFRPTADGMRVALPHVALLWPAAGVRDLRRLAAVVGRSLAR